MYKLLITLCCLLSCFTVSIPYAAAQFAPLADVNRYGVWKEGVFRHERSGMHLCLAETTGRDGTIVRINFYIFKNDSFIEFFNPRWNLPKRQLRVDLRRNDNVGLEVVGESEGDAIVFDLKSESQYRNLLGFFSASDSSVAVNVPKQNRLAEISLQGAKEAIKSLFECFDPLNRPTNNVYTGPSYKRRQ